MKKQEKSTTNFSHLLKKQGLRTQWVSACYKLAGRPPNQTCQKSGHKIDPSERIQVMELLSAPNGEGNIPLARLNLTDPRTKLSALIWIGDIHNHIG